MYCIPVLAQRCQEFYSTTTLRFFTYCGGVWNALTAISKGTLSCAFVLIIKAKQSNENFYRNEEKSLNCGNLKNTVMYTFTQLNIYLISSRGMVIMLAVAILTSTAFYP